MISDSDNTVLHRFPSGRYHIQKPPVEIVFTDVEHGGTRGDFDLYNQNGERVGSIKRVTVHNDVMNALDKIVEGEELEPDEYVNKQ